MRYLLLFFTLVILSSCDKALVESTTSAISPNGTGGSLARFTLVGNYLYVVENTNLKTYDVSNASNPVLKNTVEVGGSIETIYPYKNTLFIGSQLGMFIYTTDNPAAPKYLGAATHVRSCDPVVANDTAAFVTLRSGSACGSPADGVYFYSITDLLHPTLVSTLNLGTPYGLGLQDSTLFVCRGINGLSIINVHNILAPVSIQTITGSDFRDVIPYNGLLICYVTDGIALYDISNIANIKFIKKVLNS